MTKNSPHQCHASSIGNGFRRNSKHSSDMMMREAAAAKLVSNRREWKKNLSHREVSVNIPRRHEYFEASIILFINRSFVSFLSSSFFSFFWQFSFLSESVYIVTSDVKKTKEKDRNEKKKKDILVKFSAACCCCFIIIIFSKEKWLRFWRIIMMRCFCFSFSLKKTEKNLISLFMFHIISFE